MAMKKDAEFLIVNRRTGKALQATGIENGRVVSQAEITKADPQIWYSVTVKGGVKLKNKAASKVLDVMLGGTDNGTWAQTWEDVGGDSQIWKLTGRTYKTISHIVSGKVLDIENISEDEGANAQLWEDLSGENQQWKLVPLQESSETVSKTAKKPAARKPAAKKTAVVKTSVPSAARSAKTAKKAKTAGAAAKTEAGKVKAEK